MPAPVTPPLDPRLVALADLVGALLAEEFLAERRQPEPSSEMGADPTEIAA